MASSRIQSRREHTIALILSSAIGQMSTHGVGAVNLSDIARAIGIQPPSLFKYFPSRLALYDALFAQGARQVLDEFTRAAEKVDPGIPALRAGLEAAGRWALANQPLAQLLFWRPVPGFEPSKQAYEPSLEFVLAINEVLRDAVVRDQLRPEAATEDAQALLSILLAGATTQQLANEPGASFDAGRFTAMLPRLIDMFVEAYRP